MKNKPEKVKIITEQADIERESLRRIYEMFSLEYVNPKTKEMDLVALEEILTDSLWQLAQLKQEKETLNKTVNFLKNYFKGF